MGVRNGGQRLVATIDSVLSQSGVSFEFVVVDDGSSDETTELLAGLASTDARLRVLRNDPGLGLTRSLIRGCAASRGRFIARQDCGDRSLPGRLEAQRRAFDEAEGLIFVSGWTRYVSVQNELLYIQRGSGRAKNACAVVDLTMRHGVIDGPTHHGSVMFRRDVYEASGGYREAFYFGQDWDLWFRLAERGLYRNLGIEIYEASISPDDLSMRNKTRQEKIGALSREALQLRQAGFPDTPVLARAAEIRPTSTGSQCVSSGAGHYFIGECLRRNGMLNSAMREYREALRRDPWHWRARLRLLQARMQHSWD